MTTTQPLEVQARADESPSQADDPKTLGQRVRLMKQRRETLAAAMLLDAVTYNRSGMIAGGIWGIPVDLKDVPRSSR